MASKRELYNLARYWGRAQIMRDLIKDLIDAHGSIKKVVERGYGMRLDTYMCFWMAGLFVTIEGFNKLKCKDAGVQGLFKEHVSELKELRHATYHFTTERKEAAKTIKAINWMEEIHVALGLFIEKHVDIDGIDR
jgi:hypothetical protein